MVAVSNLVKRPTVGALSTTPVTALAFKNKNSAVTPTGLSTVYKNTLGIKKVEDPAVSLSQTNKELVRKQGLDLETILTPSGKRKKRAGLRGGDAQELATLLGE